VPSDDRLDGDAGERAAEQLPGDLFYRGTLIRLSRGGSHGVVRSLSSGREVVFERQHTIVLGEAVAGDLELREGMLVGYDVGWTSHGLRVTKLFAAPANDGERAIKAADPSGT
jgi:hypothetical protein